MFQKHYGSVSLEPDQDSVGPDLGPNCLQRLSSTLDKQCICVNTQLKSSNKSTASTAEYPATAGGTKSYFVRYIMPK